ncbi:phosphopantetheine adenylyltransferase, partial [Bifidobacteriaceae bacterium NR003]
QNGDYEAELGMALVNRKLAGIETLFLPADPILEHVSSSVVKDVARHGGNVTGMVPDNVIPLLQKLFAEQSSDQSNNSVTLNN